MGRPDAKVRKLMAASSTAQPPGVVKTLTDDKKRKRPVKKRRGKKLTVAESEAESEAQAEAEAEAEAEAARSSKRRRRIQRICYDAGVRVVIPKARSHENIKRHEVKYKEATSNKNGMRVGDVQRFRELIGNMRFWDQLQAALALLPPLKDSIRFMEGDNTRMSYVCELFTGLIIKDLHQWVCSALDHESVKNLKQSANTTFLRRWKGEDRLVALFHPIHEVAFLLDPFMAEAGHTLNGSIRQHVRTILGKYCSSPPELDASMLEVNEYIAGVWYLH
eukprot:jgi/Tetstr1/428668/TSEL_018656.t1